MTRPAYLGLDFGTQSVRALALDGDGTALGATSVDYPHGQLVTGREQGIFRDPLPSSWALQHPDDWLDAGGRAAEAVALALDDHTVAGIGVDFTSCTVVPTTADGQALATSTRVDPGRPHAWPKLWKHHGALEQADRMTRLAVERGEPWLDRYGGIVGLEWFFPKIVEVLEGDEEVAEATEVWLEAGDWVVWQLTGGSRPIRSTCQAGYKALWSEHDGYPSDDYLRACLAALPDVVADRLPGRFLPPGACAGPLRADLADRWGLTPGTPVATAIIDAHAGVPGAGVGGPGALVLVMGTSGCHMVMDPDEHHIDGVAGVVRDGILPGHFGYETGQAAMGDLFEWVRSTTGADDHGELTDAAAEVGVGSDGLLVLDWFNGCRTPLMDGRLTGAMLGLGLHHGPAHLYRGALEASASGTAGSSTRWWTGAWRSTGSSPPVGWPGRTRSSSRSSPTSWAGRSSSRRPTTARPGAPRSSEPSPPGTSTTPPGRSKHSPERAARCRHQR